MTMKGASIIRAGAASIFIMLSMAFSVSADSIDELTSRAVSGAASFRP